jgi:hypothetical protein
MPGVSYMPDARPPASESLRATVAFQKTKSPSRKNTRSSKPHELDPAEYAVIVKMRGPTNKPWMWEITAPGNNKPVQRSSESFPTMSAALRAGKEALRVFLKQ